MINNILIKLITYKLQHVIEIFIIIKKKTLLKYSETFSDAERYRISISDKLYRYR